MRTKAGLGFEATIAQNTTQAVSPPREEPGCNDPLFLISHESDTLDHFFSLSPGTWSDVVSGYFGWLIDIKAVECVDLL
jgi:hypothetical protein